MSSSTPHNALSYPNISIYPTSDNPSARNHLIYFITGNPGLIGYYDTFLNTLHTLLSQSTGKSSETDVVSIYGQSLAGFEEETIFSNNTQKTTPYSLDEVIEISLKSLQGLGIASGVRKGQQFASVILIGHSVGSYILLEIIQRLRKRGSPINIRAGILLFPTVTDISQSPSGLKITKLFKIPDFPKKASMVAKSLISVTPENVLRWLVGIVTRMPEDSVEVTTTFLRSSMGIWQAL
jgi:Lipid-droplet associated hydrolase